MKIRNKETGEIREIDPQELRDYGLDIPEAKNGIHIKESHKGLLHKQLGVAEGKKIPASKLKIKPSDSETTRKRKQFAINASRWKHQDGGQAMEQQDQMQQLIQMAEQALAQGASPEEVAQMLVQKGVPEQVVQQVIQYAIQDLQQQQQAQGQNLQEEAQEQMQQQNPQEEQAEMGYGGMSMYGHGGMIKRADGSYSKRGLWDNIRANKGSGKAPTKEMLEQEKKIKAAEKGMGGMMYADGGKLPKDILKFRLESHMSPQEVNNYLKEYANGGSFDNPGFRALPMYVQEKIKSNMAYGGCMECGGKMETGGRFLRKAQVGLITDNTLQNSLGQPLNLNQNNSWNTQQNYQPYNLGIIDNTQGYDPNTGGNLNTNFNVNNNPISYPSLPTDNINLPGNNLGVQNVNNTNGNFNYSFSRPKQEVINFNKMGENTPLTVPQGNNLNLITEGPNLGLSDKDKTNKYSKFNDYNKYIGNITGGNSYFGRGIQHLGQATFDFAKGGIELAGTNISNRNALGDEARNLQNSMRAGYQRVGKRPTDGNAIISKYGGRMMQDGGATYADKMKVSKNSPEADFVAEKGEYIVNNGVASKLETGGSHASGNDTAISLDKSSNPSYVLSDTSRLKQLQFGGKRVSPAKYAEMATVEVLGKTPDQILKGYTAFTKRANTEGKVFGDKISDATNQLLAQKYQKDLATVKQIADQAYHKQEQLKYAMGMDNDLDHAQQVNGIQMAQYGGMQDDVHMNYFNAPAVQYGGSPQLFSDPSELGYNTTQMAYGGLHKMQNAGNANPYSGWKGQRFSTPEGITTPTGINLNVDPRGNWADFAQKYSTYDPRITAKQTPEAIGALQEVIYDEYLDTPQGQEALNKMWLDFGVTNKLEKDYSDIATKIKNKENLTESDLKKLRANYIDTYAGKRLPKMLNEPTITTPKPEAKESKPPIVESQEVDKKPFEYTPAEEKDTYDIPPVNFYIPQPYGRNPIGLQLAQAQTIRPAKLNIQPELNEYTRGMRGALRGTQGNTSVNVAQQMQGLNNLYNAQNRLFGQKYNFDEQSRMGAEQFNAQAIMNVDAANLQRIAAEQDAIARREGILDTQRRTDFQAGIENADKQNAYNLSKKYIESTFGPYLNNQGKLNFTYDPDTGEKINKGKEKTYTASELNKMTPEQRKALGLKFGGSVKKIKLKLRK